MVRSMVAMSHEVQSVLRGRRLVVVDIENVVGGAVKTQEQAMGAYQVVKQAAALKATEQVIVGTSHIGAVTTGCIWSRARMVVKSGQNGADLALLEVLTAERIAQRFDEVALVSGDGIFTDIVAQLGSDGVKVTVVAQRGRCSKRLRMAATHTVLFEDPTMTLGDAA